MARTLTAGMASAVAAQRGQVVHLIELVTDGGATRLCTAHQDLSWNAQTWEAIGGALSIGGVEESGDTNAQGLQLELAGVDPAIIALILANDFRGRSMRIWRAFISEATGTVIADPLEVFRGLQLEPYEIREQRGERNTVTVSTRVVSRLVELDLTRAVLTDLPSHRAMLARAGLAVTDTGFQLVGGLRKDASMKGGDKALWGRG